jgi:transposase-like protein
MAFVDHDPDHKRRIIALARRGVTAAAISRALYGLISHQTIENWIREDRQKRAQPDQTG